MEAHGTHGFTHGSTCIAWNSWKRIETTKTFPDDKGNGIQFLVTPITQMYAGCGSCGGDTNMGDDRNGRPS